MKTRILFNIFLLGSLVSYAQVSTLPYTQDFEGSTFPPQNWQFFGSNSNASWEHSKAVGAYGLSSGSAFFDNFTTPLAGNYYGLRTVSFDLTDAVEPTMQFDVAYALRTGGSSDRLGIWYSLNGTSNWINITNYQDLSLRTAPDQSTYFTPTPLQWDSIILDLTQFAGTPFIRFAFENNCSNGNVLYIDNVTFYDASKPTGIKTNEQAENKIRIFPNPSTGRMIQINSIVSSQAGYRLYNQTGQQMENIKTSTSTANGNVTLDLNGFNAGIYYLVVTHGSGNQHSEKLILE